MQRHRDQQRRVGRHQPRHESRDRVGIGEPTPIFQLQHDSARDLAIGDRSANAVMGGCVRQAFAAQTVPAIDFERTRAACAPRLTQKAQSVPACAAKPVIVPGHRAASRTARRQRECGKPAERCEESIDHTHLSRARAGGTSRAVDASEIFDPKARARARDRAARAGGDADFVRDHMMSGIVERIEALDRDFSDILDVGAWRGGFAWKDARITRTDAGAGFARANGGLQVEEDRLPFGEHAFDLVVSAASLDQVNDLPGALTLIRRTLRPGGLFVGAFLGAGTLATLRQALRNAEPEPPAPRLHPQIDVRSAGDLLSRAGFANPVADTETLWVRYSGMARLIDDLRGMAATNLLRTRQPMSRGVLMCATDAFSMLAEPDGKTRERFDIVYVTGNAPDETAKPRRRGGAAFAPIAVGLPEQA